MLNRNPMMNKVMAMEYKNEQLDMNSTSVHGKLGSKQTAKQVNAMFEQAKKQMQGQQS